MKYLKVLFILIGFAAVAGLIYFRKSAAPQTTESLERQLKNKLCTDLPDDGYAVQCEKMIDAANLKNYSNLAWRDGDKLFLKLSQGEPKVLSNDEEKIYSLYGYFEAQDLFLVSAFYNEGGGYLLIDRKAGAEYNVIAPPVFSPDGKKFVSASMDLGEAAYDPNGIEIWEKKSDQWVNIFRRDFVSDGLSNPRWVNDQQIVFNRYLPGEDEPKYVGETNGVFKDDQWVLNNN